MEGFYALQTIAIVLYLLFIVIVIHTFFRISYDTRIMRKIMEKQYGELSKEEVKELRLIKYNIKTKQD